MPTDWLCEKHTPPSFRRATMQAPSVQEHTFYVKFCDGLFFHRKPTPLILNVPAATLTVADYTFAFHLLEVNIGLFAHDATLRDVSSNVLVTIRAHDDKQSFETLRSYLHFISHSPFGYVPVSLIQPSGHTSLMLQAFPQANPDALVVLKHTRRTDLRYLGISVREFLAARKCLQNIPPHPNVPQIIAVGTTSDALITVMPYVRTDLQKFLQLTPSPSPSALLHLAHGILSALAHLHAHGIVHRNIHPANILVDGDATNPIALLCGFSHAYNFNAPNEIPQGLLHKWAARTPPKSFCAPELSPNPISPAGTTADVWSVGIVLFLIFLRRFPWGNEGDKQFYSRRDTLFAAIERAAADGQGHWDLLDVKNDDALDVPDSVKSLLAALLQPIAGRRLSARAALEHPAFASIRNQSVQNSSNHLKSFQTARPSSKGSYDNLDDIGNSLQRRRSTMSPSGVFRRVVSKIRVTKSTVDCWAQRSGVQITVNQ